MPPPKLFGVEIPFVSHLGFELVHMEGGVSELKYLPKHEHMNSFLVTHGGAIMTLADSVGAVCAFLNLPEGASTSTTSSATTFVRGVRSGIVTALARPLHVGRSTIAVVTEVRDDSQRLVAQVTQSQAVLAG